jgi:hypothetical protein
MSPGFENLTPLVCSDDIGDSVQSEVVFAVARGQSYVIRVSAGLESSGGSLAFHLGPA